MKKILTLLILVTMPISLNLATITPAIAATTSVVSDASVQIVGVYNKYNGPTNFVDLSGSPLNAVRAQEPKPYPTGYVSEPPEVLDSVWDTGTNLYFQNTNPGADWIWETERAEGPANYPVENPLYDPAAYTNGRVVVFQKNFTINGEPQPSTLHITADNGWEVWINGQFLARSATAKVAGWELTNLREAYLSTTGWQAVGHITVPSSMLINGENTIKILAGNEYFWSDDGNNPSPALNLNPYYQYNPGALIFKLDLSYNPISPLVVTKDAATSYDRTWNWTVNKLADQSALTLATGETYPVNYTINVNSSTADSNWAVTGNIHVINPNEVAAVITNITDIVSPDITMTIDCGSGFVLPYSLGAGQTLDCTYSGALPDATERINTVTVSTDQNGFVPGANATANVIFTDPTNLIDDCVNVSDTYTGSLGTVCQTNQTFNYTRTIGPYQSPGTYTVDNTASFITNDTQKTGDSSWTITVTVPSPGCTLTQGYWKTHSSYGPAPFDDTWSFLTSGADTIFFLSNKSYYQILWTPVGGNVYYQLAHQYIASKLNILNGADSSAIQTALNSATTLFNTYTPAQIAALKGNSPIRQQFSSLAGSLGSYNEGLTGPGHCNE